MKKLTIGLLAVLLFCSSSAFAGNPYNQSTSYGQNNGSYGQNNGSNGGFGQVDPNDHAVVTLLWLVYSDLQMCQSSMKQTLMDNVSAIGHLNNSQSALKKATIDPAYHLLIREINKRISKIKFYLVMNEKRAVQQRIQQLMQVIKNVLGASSGQLPGNTSNYNPHNNNNGGNFGNPNNSGFIPMGSPETPVGNPGNNGISIPTFPSGVVPVR
ncbi:MAG: hypothetical protein ACQETH_03785 [Candidatus Rifleibacteriota bacterium]